MNIVTYIGSAYRAWIEVGCGDGCGMRAGIRGTVVGHATTCESARGGEQRSSAPNDRSSLESTEKVHCATPRGVGLGTSNHPCEHPNEVAVEGVGQRLKE